MTHPTPARAFLQFVDADLAADEFLHLSQTEPGTYAGAARTLATLPRDNTRDQEADHWYSVDLVDGDDGFTILDDCPVTEETVRRLLGVDDLEPLRERARAHRSR